MWHDSGFLFAPRNAGVKIVLCQLLTVCINLLHDFLLSTASAVHVANAFLYQVSSRYQSFTVEVFMQHRVVQPHTAIPITSYSVALLIPRV